MIFKIQGSEILDASITTSDQSIGAEEGNVAEISFSPPSGLDESSGFIKLTCPQWAIDYEYDIEMKHIEYPHMAKPPNTLDCTSDAFESLEIEEFEDSESVLLLKYTSCNAGMCDPDTKVKISCTNWRNPNLAIITPGYSLITFNSDGENPQDYSSQFTFDGSNLQPEQIEDSSFEVELTDFFPNEVTDYKITFETPNHIDSDAGCFVKYTFPEEIDISQVDLKNIRGSDMLVDREGAVHTY